ncbi:hypothetical protein ACK8HX_02635 [Oryzobacter sp. R7]|uniref:hypothetical protein n=1 Tax=Oryzobacter faecalis TaxID=3388656 RepID=UPI00398C8A88
MSQLAPVRSAPRPGARRATTPTPRQLKVVTPPETAGNGLFLALCVALLLGGFVGVLVLNTAMAQGSYTMRDLQHRSDELADTQDALRHQIDAVSGPGPLAQRARGLGMVPAETPAFLRLSDGKVLGVATKAKANDRFSVVTETKAPTRSTAVPTTPSTTRTPPSSVPSTAPGATRKPTTPATPSTRATPATPGN